jgi:hypothetical protein
MTATDAARINAELYGAIAARWSQRGRPAVAAIWARAAVSAGRVALEAPNGAPGDPRSDDLERRRPLAPPDCGHSACRQHWIDTGRRACIATPCELGTCDCYL